MDVAAAMAGAATGQEAVARRRGQRADLLVDGEALAIDLPAVRQEAAAERGVRPVGGELDVVLVGHRRVQATTPSSRRGAQAGHVVPLGLHFGTFASVAATDPVQPFATSSAATAMQRVPLLDPDNLRHVVGSIPGIAA
jgi:hypothetical protein